MTTKPLTDEDIVKQLHMGFCDSVGCTGYKCNMALLAYKAIRMKNEQFEAILVEAEFKPVSYLRLRLKDLKKQVSA